MQDTDAAPRPHVLMLMTTPWHFGTNWARSASLVARVTTLSRVRELRWEPFPAIPWMARNPADDADFEVLESPLRPWRPTRLFAGLAERHLNSRLVTAAQVLQHERGRVDCLHSHFAAIWDVDHACQVLGLPFVHTEHATTFLPEQPMLHKRLSSSGLRRARRLFRRASTVTFVSRHLRDAVARRGISGRFEVVPNPVDTQRFHPTPLPPRGGGVRLLSIGRLAPEKDPELLLRAFALASESAPGLTLEILGSGPVEQRTRALAAELGLAERVKFLGFVPNQQLPAVIARAHVFVTATKIETFGVAIAEALACGRPVVAPRIGPLPDLVAESRGVLVTPNDVEAFARGILQAGTAPFDPFQIAREADAGWSDRVVAESLRAVYAHAVSLTKSA